MKTDVLNNEILSEILGQKVKKIYKDTINNNICFEYENKFYVEQSSEERNINDLASNIKYLAIEFMNTKIMSGKSRWNITEDNKEGDLCGYAEVYKGGNRLQTFHANSEWEAVVEAYKYIKNSKYLCELSEFSDDEIYEEWHNREL